MHLNVGRKLSAGVQKAAKPHASDVHLRLPRELVERREARDAPFGRQAHDGGPRVRVFQGVVVGRVDAVVQIAEREDDRLA